MKKNFLLLLWMTLLPFAAFAADITVNLVNLQYEYGAPLPVVVTTDMFSVQGALPGEVTKEQVAAALNFNYLDGDNKNVGNHHYSLTTKANYNGAGTPLEGHTIYLFGGGNDGLIKIVAKPIQADWFERDGALTFNGSEQTQAFKPAEGAPEDVTFTVSTNTGTNAGNYVATITGTGNYGGEVQVGFAIGKYKLTLDNIADIEDKVFQGSSQKPTPTFTGIESPMEIVAADYEVTYPSEGQYAYIVPGTYDVKVAFTENGNYFADNDGNALVKQFTITPYEITKNDEYIEAGLKGITITPADAVTFDGLQHQDAPTIKFGNNVLGAHNYKITYTSTEDGAYVNAKDGWEVTVTFKGNNFTHDALTSKVVINQKPLEDVMIANIDDQTYDKGTPITPDLTVKFNNGEADVNLDADDYTVEYTNNINAGTATATITAVEGGNYSGTASKKFTIKPIQIRIKPVNLYKNYGQADPTWAKATAAEPKMYELVDGDDNVVEDAVLNGTVVLGRVTGETVKDYVIYVIGYNPGETADNYAPTDQQFYVDEENRGEKLATFTILPQEGALVLKFTEEAIAEKASKIYGNDDPVWSINDLEVVSGLANNDVWDNIKGGLVHGEETQFAPISQQVADNETNQVKVTGLYSENYPNVTVTPMPFTIEKRPIAVKVKTQTIDYGTDIEKTSTSSKYWSFITDGWNGNTTDTKADLNLVLSTVKAIGTYAPGSETANAIKATISNDNYVLTNTAEQWGTLKINEVSEIVLDPTQDMANDINNFNGKTVKVKFANMTMKAKEWYAIVLPFATTPAELVKGLGMYVVCNHLDTENSTDQNYKFTLQMDELPAGVPFLIKPAQNLDWADFDLGMEVGGTTEEPSDPVAVKKTIVSAITPAVAYLDDKELVTFTGTYAKGEILGVPGKPSAETATILGECWWLSDTDYEASKIANDWRKPKNNAHALKSMEAYLLAGEGWTTYSPSFTVEDFDGQTTSIKTLGAETIHNMLTEGWYTLNGVKLQSAPTQKGVYINNGKKVVIR
jgi:hypothetical protein